MNWKRNTFADYAHAAVASLVVASALWGYNFTVTKLFDLDWQFFGTIASVAAAIVALRIAGADRSKKNDEQMQRAVALSVGIDLELAVVIEHCQVLARSSNEASTHFRTPMNYGDQVGNARVLGLLGVGVAMIKVPLLERFIDRATDFDIGCAAQLTKTLSAILQLTSRPVPTSDGIPEDQLHRISDTVGRNAAAILREAGTSRERIRPYMDRIAIRRPPEVGGAVEGELG